ncbi:MAG: dicarboxylate/amino acid:cation symporter [Bradymonadia bacterium]|jgi:DAACS family dicarboxylate/amino acid:cation (Na+ or H+) symporter
MAALHTRMAIFGGLGALGGAVAHIVAAGTPELDTLIRYVAQPIGQVYIRLLLMLVIPLVFSSLALGIAGVGDLSRFGRIGMRTLVYTVLVSLVAVLIGLTVANVFRPGETIDEAQRALLMAGSGDRAASIVKDASAKGALEMLVGIVPSNAVRAAAEGDMIGFMFFALFIGIGLLLTDTPAARRFQEGLEGLYDVSMRLIGLVIKLSPYGVCALLFALTAQLGFSVLVSLAAYVGVVVLGLAVHQFVVYAFTVRVFGGMRPLDFYRGVQEAMLTAFSTASSSATLPTALRVAEEKLKLPADVSRFVLTIGSTANQNGTALFEGVTVLFLAQVYGVDLSLAQQLQVLFVCVLGGIGTAGVPAGSLPVIVMILGMIGVPVEAIGLILGVDRFLDMCRTTLNVTGDLAAAVVVAGPDARRA